MLGTGWTEAGALVAYVVAVLATPAGISGAVLLLPFQVSVLGTPSPAVTPTNLLYNVVASPGALYRYWRQHQTGGRLALVLIAGTLPGVITGSVIRVELLPGPQAFDLVVAAVLVPLGIWLALTRPGRPDESDRPPPADPRSSPGGPRGCGGPRGRDLRNRQRLDPGTHPLGHYQKVLTTVYLRMDSWNRRPSMPWE